MLMALSEKKVSRLRVGRITVQTIETLRILRDFLGVTFQISSADK
jgi:RNA 3'-terminal phosphate cyclase-like protein